IASDAAMALNVSPQTEQIIATLIGAGGLWRSQCTDVPMWKALITNEVSTAEQFKAKVDHFLWLEDVPSGLSRIIYANFGVFGELPVLLIRLEECSLLMDPTNGNLSGPFALTSSVDATALLSTHSDAYHAGYPIRYFTSKGTPFIAASELPNAPCEAAPATPCNATTVNTVACGSNGNERCSCRLNGTNYEWTCTTCPPGKSCQVIQTPGGGTGLKCQ
ncbi:MAG: hypothetical protein K2W85_12680, partial [Phycisphaerales bacterium]|nr:hypothetical protein [Phycisphaerales bacterium]